MDWPESTQPILTVLPRGMSRDGGRARPAGGGPRQFGALDVEIREPGHLDLRHRHRRRIERAWPRRPQQTRPASRMPWTTRRRCSRRSMCSTRSRS
ncbi:MAG: hypothetical protein ACXWJ8_09230, partial [Xanthobacteraceae bacterium]